MADYTYLQSLDGGDIVSGKAKIRVLHLLPSGDTAHSLPRTSTLSCKMHLMDLDTTSQYYSTSRYSEDTYEALSYTWGTAAQTRNILINNYNFPVTENLETALRHLQLQEGDRIIWVDAVCINQKDNSEKNHQVQMMAKIYERAKKVIIWLGPEAQESALALQRLDLLGLKCLRILTQRQISFHELRDPQPRHDLQTLSQKVHDLTVDFESALQSVGYEEESWLKPINHLLSRPWFERAWIVQELAVAQRPELFCGQQSIPWSHFAAGFMLLAFRTEQAVQRREWEFQGTGHEQFFRFAKLYGGCVHTLVRFRDEFQATSSRRLAFKYIVESITTRGHLLCKDPRDRIFSIVGLAKDLDPWAPRRQRLVPDYTLSTADVFAKTTRAIIHSCWNNSADCLRILTFNQTEKGLADLPSWVPDWTIPFCENIAGDFNTPIYYADMMISPPKISLSVQHIFPTDEILKLAGVHFDAIFELGQSYEEMAGQHPGLSDVVHEWIVNCACLFQFKPGNYRSLKEMKGLEKRCVRRGSFPYGPTYPYDPDELRKAMAKTMICDHRVDQLAPPGYYGVECDGDSNRAGPLETLMFNCWFGKGQVPESFLRGVDLPRETRRGRFLKSYAERAHLSAVGKRPIISTKGYFGLVPSTALPGDKLVIFFGASIPFVVRKHGDYHELIGGCYVHGAMDGEMVNGRPYPIDAFELK
ncbi:heterokaryon incompatibility protein-domain-containing protein [Hyaloscypha sp. PMI_1271]|nr:heterokaryon incompatibility protein-domain-containing protein [Hyaloscypha sp. PMI_1271]